MPYKIIYDKPGRLRVRLGRGKFTKPQARSIERLLTNTTGVLSAQATQVNGGILIYYEATHRAGILGLLDNLVIKDLPLLEEDSAVSELDSQFARAFSVMLGKYFFAKIFLPAPVRVVLTVKNALPYWKKGLTALGRGKLNVDVLDATAITASMSKGDFATAASIMALLRITDLLEDYTRKKAGATLSQSLVLNIDHVWVVTDAGDVKIPMSHIAVDRKSVV